MTITRVRWRERQRVSAADLRAEQLYRLESLGRHFLAPHDWGVVRGLWLVSNGSPADPGWQLLPGVAIDGYGRELLVREPIDIELPAGAARMQSYRVFLYYCESPSSCPPCKPCRDDPAPRTWQHVQVVVSKTLTPITGPAADLGLARAAGAIPDQPAWPVLVGAVARAGEKPDYEDVRYHAQRASLLRSPSGSVALRQGLLGPDDQYQLLLSTSPDSASPVKRFGIDRDGIVHVWKQLELTGPDLSAKIALSETAALFIDAPALAGIAQHVVVKGMLEQVNDPHLIMHWSDASGAREVVRAHLPGKEKAHLDRTLLVRDTQPIALSLVNLNTGRPMQVTRSGGRGKERTFILQDFAAELRSSDGQLALATRKVAVDSQGVAPCDGDSRSSGSGPAERDEGGVAYFRPAAQPTPAPTARAIQTVAGERPDGMPTTAFRMVGGEFDEGDHTPRIAFGSRLPAGSDLGWHSMMTIDGGGRVRMPYDETTLDVTHTLQLPPITTNPTDPLTQDLLALAFSAGLRRAGRIMPSGEVDVVFPAAETKVSRGGTLTYDITIKNNGANPATLKRVIECVVGSPELGEPANADVALRTIPGLTGTINAGGSISFTTPSTDIPLFQHAAAHVVIAVEIVVAILGKDYVFSGVSTTKMKVTD